MGSCCSSNRSSGRSSPTSTSPNTANNPVTTSADATSSRANIIANNPSSLASPRASHISSAEPSPRPDARPNRRLVAPANNGRAKRPKTLRSGLSRSLSDNQNAGGALLGSSGSLPSTSMAGTASTDAPWTLSQLAAERTAFWETQVTGRPQNWAAVRVVAEHVARGDVAVAQGVLDAAGLTCPTGRVWEGVFDEWGEAYQVPEWVVVMPRGVIEEEEGEGVVGDVGAETDKGMVVGSWGTGLGVGEEKEKGKERAVEVEREKVKKVRARLSDGRPDVVVKMGESEKVAVLVERICGVVGLPAMNNGDSPQPIKIAYLGKLLHPNQTLTQQGWHDGHVVNALVFSS
ncbi:hypothetical protein K490DRAFT_55731 [Saccharata proteae CBS 121410]|uniref:DC-UbP/UBTD2 N-terminal domain-containing protein n=1 Tax=Saccharata proteae CBS 121410 TaxID=1314787 RepID=A0A6A5YCR2_9PEZI|nr:hypothetical protein K490DRAFT_55731 [Saccharata proteae CBS 121410]